jgi:hypothetical protein
MSTRSVSQCDSALQIKDVLSSGTGDFDQERLLHQLPKELSLSEKKVHRAVEDQAKDRKRTTLVQAVSYLRQKKMDDTVKALNNLVACNKVSCCDHFACGTRHESDLFQLLVKPLKLLVKQMKPLMKQFMHVRCLEALPTVGKQHLQAMPSGTWHACYHCTCATMLGKTSGLAWPLAPALNTSTVLY